MITDELFDVSMLDAMNTHDPAINRVLELMSMTTCGTESCRVLDLGCGSGVLSSAVAQRFPDAEVTALVAAGHELPQNLWGVERVEARRVDLNSIRWLTEMAAPGFDAVVSATGLGWLGPQQLVRLCQVLPQVLNASAIVVGVDEALMGESLPGHFRLGRDFHLQALRAAGFVATTLPSGTRSDGVMFAVYP